MAEHWTGLRMSNSASTTASSSGAITAAAVHERLPLRVPVDPAIDAFLVGQEQFAVLCRAQERPVLRAEIGAVGLHDGRAVADGRVQALQVPDGHLRLPLEYRFDVLPARGRADIPFLDIADAFRACAGTWRAPARCRRTSARQRCRTAPCRWSWRGARRAGGSAPVRSSGTGPNSSSFRPDSSFASSIGPWRMMASKKCPPAGIRPLGGTERSLAGHCSRSPLGSYCVLKSFGTSTGVPSASCHSLNSVCGKPNIVRCRAG